MGELLDKIKGRIKHATGVMTDDSRLVKEGKKDEIKGNAKGAVKGAKRVARNVKESVKDAAK